MKQIAVYGKGGIGKSTTCANISYLLAGRGLKVVQIGCDPKHDSTRLLIGGKSQRTLLDYKKSESTDDDGLVMKGKNNVICMETGGPEPGVGCAGRGILTAFDIIKEKSLIPEDTDVVIYDVLGDVVCGGFAVPLRRQYADIVFIVTSGEFMSLYAANNVLKGIRNFDYGSKRVAGLILNSRGGEDEYDYVKNFADAVGLPIITMIPRSEKFSKAESNGTTVSEMFPDSEEVHSYAPIVDLIASSIGHPIALYDAEPLDDDDLDLVAKGRKVVRKGFAPPLRKLATDERNALRSCGIRVVSHCCLNVIDSELIVHGPNCCALYYSSNHDRRLINEGRTDLKSVYYRSFSTALDDRASIFGGGKALEDLIRQRLDHGAKLLFVITACVPGIIGDDTVDICTAVQSEYHDAKVVPILMDGILCGGGIQGMNLAIEGICGLTDPSVAPDPRLVNIIGSGNSGDRELDCLDDTGMILEGLGLKINCRFLDRCPSDDIVHLKRGSIDLMFASNMSVINQAKIVEKTTGIGWYPEALPRGLDQTTGWIRKFGAKVGCPQEAVDSLCDRVSRMHKELMEPLAGRLKGRTALVYTDTTSDIEWLFEVLRTLEVDVLEVLCPTNSVWNDVSPVLRTGYDVAIRYDVNLDGLKEEIQHLGPTFTIGNHYTLSSLDTPHMVVPSPRPGVSGCAEVARRLIRMSEVISYEDYRYGRLRGLRPRSGQLHRHHNDTPRAVCLQDAHVAPLRALHKEGVQDPGRGLLLPFQQDSLHMRGSG